MSAVKHKAVLYVRKNLADTDSPIINRLRENLENLIETDFDKEMKGKGFFKFPVQYNPATLSLSNISSDDEEEFGAGTENGTSGMVALNTRSTLSFDLIFESADSAADKNFVKRQSEKILALLLDSSLSYVVFCYGGMVFQGELTQADIRYTMFDIEGNPVWAEISVSITEKPEEPEEGPSSKESFSNDELLYRYSALREEYDGFQTPVAVVKINQKDISDNKSGLSISDVQVELTSGFEASMAVFSIYNSFDKKTASFRTEEIKKYIYLGSSISVSMGYKEVAKRIFSGFIAKVNFICEDEEMPYVQVTCMDVKGIMMSGSYARQMAASCYSEAVKEIFGKNVYTKMQAQEIFTDLSIAETPDRQNNSAQSGESDRTIEMVNESDYEFVVRAAKKFNYEFFVDSGIVIFRRAKSADSVLMELELGEVLKTFDIEYDITGLVKAIDVRGMDTGKMKLISSKQKYDNKISMGNKAKQLLKNSEKVYIDPTVKSQQDADYRGAYLIEDMSYRFGTLTCECVGLPELKPGSFIKIKNLGEPADNRFYITEVSHRIDSEGVYTSRITAKASSVL